MANCFQFLGTSPMQTTTTTYPHADLAHNVHQQHASFVGNPHGQPQYLPEYLLGDPTSVVTAPVDSHRMWSSSVSSDPCRSLSNVKNKSSTTLSSTNTPSRLNLSSMTGEKPLGGPPTEGLFVSSGVTSPNMSRSFINQSSSFARTPTSGAEKYEAANVNNRSNFSSMSPAQLDPFYTQGESLQADEELDGTWVTVFGFSPSAVSFVLQQFSQYGNILEHKMSGGDNWVHIHYQSRIQAKKALSKNGKIFWGNMMVGVTQCIDKSVMNESTKENMSFANSPLSFRLRSKADSAGSIGRSTNRISGMRPLSEAYSAAASDQAVVTGGNCTPQRKGGVVNKAMEYVFGW